MRAQVQPHNGTPTLFLNDQPVFADIHWVGYLGPHGLEATQASIRAFARNNVHIYSTDALSFERCGPQAGNGRPFDFAPVGPRLQTAIDDRAIAYQIGTGTCGEWIKDWSSMSPASGDFSEPMRRKFRAWLRQRYAADPAALQAAWSDPQATIENAEVPSGEEASTGLFYTGSADRLSSLAGAQ